MRSAPTVLSGAAAIRLKHAGLASIGLVHEMPHSIRANRWTDHAAALIQGVQSLVFPCPQVLWMDIAALRVYVTRFVGDWEGAGEGRLH